MPQHAAPALTAGLKAGDAFQQSLDAERLGVTRRNLAYFAVKKDK